jgi:hypothetical protein
MPHQDYIELAQAIMAKNEAFDQLSQAELQIARREHSALKGKAEPVPSTWLAWRSRLAATYEAMKAEFRALRHRID